MPFVGTKLARKERIINNFARITQFVTWPLLFVIFHTLFNIRIKGRRNFKYVRSPFIIISNHISFYDSFLFRLVLGVWTPHLPLRFMAVRRFSWRFLNFLETIGIIDLIYSLFGVFIVVPGAGLNQNLVEAREIIRAGGNVVIYPEGKIVVDHSLASFKKGAAVLTRDTGVSVIPVIFKDFEGGLRRKIRVTVGGPMQILPGMSIEDMTRSFYNTEAELYARTQVS